MKLIKSKDQQFTEIPVILIIREKNSQIPKYLYQKVREDEC